jgi:hypothetical protein
MKTHSILVVLAGLFASSAHASQGVTLTPSFVCKATQVMVYELPNTIDIRVSLGQTPGGKMVGLFQIDRTRSDSTSPSSSEMYFSDMIKFDGNTGVGSKYSAKLSTDLHRISITSIDMRQVKGTYARNDWGVVTSYPLICE